MSGKQYNKYRVFKVHTNRVEINQLAIFLSEKKTDFIKQQIFEEI